MVEMRKVLGATTSDTVFLAAEKDGAAQHEASVASVAAGAQQVSAALTDAFGAQQVLSAVAAGVGPQHASTVG
jgi:hypothetical protein